MLYLARVEAVERPRVHARRCREECIRAQHRYLRTAKTGLWSPGTQAQIVAHRPQADRRRGGVEAAPGARFGAAGSARIARHIVRAAAPTY